MIPLAARQLAACASQSARLVPPGSLALPGRARGLALSSRLTLQAANAWPDPAARAALARGLRRGDRGQLEPAYFGSDGPLQCAAFLTASRQHGNSTAACAPG